MYKDKGRERTTQVIEAGKRVMIADEIRKVLEQHKFDRLVRSGVIIRDEQVDREFWAAHKVLGQTIETLNAAAKGKSMLNIDGGGQGEGGLRSAISTCQSL